jgi:hypothetical protein
MESCASRHRPPPRHLAGRNLEAVGELEVGSTSSAMDTRLPTAPAMEARLDFVVAAAPPDMDSR